MKKYKLANFLSLVCLLILGIAIGACSQKNVENKDSQIAILMPYTDINTSIILSTYPYCPGTKLAISYPFCILIENKSEETIKFSTDLGIRIYQYRETEAQWSEVENGITYHGNEIILIQEGADDGVWNFLETVKPELQNSETPIKVRIIVSGNKLQDKGEEPVGAYLDVMLEP